MVWHAEAELGVRKIFHMPKEYTHAEWSTNPTVLLIVFDSENAWCPHSWAMIQSPVPRSPAVKPYRDHTENLAIIVGSGPRELLAVTAASASEAALYAPAMPMKSATLHNSSAPGTQIDVESRTYMTQT